MDAGRLNACEASCFYIPELHFFLRITSWTREKVSWRRVESLPGGLWGTGRFLSDMKTWRRFYRFTWPGAGFRMGPWELEGLWRHSVRCDNPAWLWAAKIRKGQRVQKRR